MLDFEKNTHLIVELHTEDGVEVVGGFLDAVTDLGVTLRTTHRVQKIVPKITDEVSGSIKRAVSEIPVWVLRGLAAVGVRDVRALWTLTVEDMRKIVEFQQEQEYVRANTRTDMAPLSVSVKTFYSHGVIRSAEVTEDYNVETAMSGLDAELDKIRRSVLIEAKELEGKNASDSDEAGEGKTGEDKDVES